jgi:hypothetical protein
MRAALQSRKNRDVVRAAARDAVEALEGRTLLSNVPFVAQTPLTTSASHAHASVIADVDGDGDNDVVTASQTDNTVAWFENNGSGSFTRHVISTSEPGARTVFVIDLNGDGHMDIISAAEQGDVKWYQNDGNENFTAHSITTGNVGANDVSVADIAGDHDGHLDVISDNQTADSLVWYENDGHENFTPHTIAASAGTIKDTTPVDLDRDGDADIITAAQTGNKVVWYENDGAGGFTPHTIDSAATGTFSAVAGDLDGDGDIDVTAACNGNNSIVWYENLGNESFTKHTLTSSAQGAIRVFIADVDSDGDSDILATDFGDDKVQWFENLGDGSFSSAHVIASSFNQATDVTAGDLDGDGDNDVVASSFQDNTIRWFKNTGGRLQLNATSTAASGIGNGAADDVLKITATHLGQTGDNPDHLSSIGVAFLSASSATALSTAQASALLSSVSVYRDANADGAFDGSDTLVTSVNSLSLSGSGVQTIGLPAGDPNANFGPNAPATFFVVLTMKPDASSQAVNSFRVSSASGTATDRVTNRVLVNVITTPATTPAIAATAVSPPPGPPPSPPPPPPGTLPISATAEGSLPDIAVSGEKTHASVRVTVSNPDAATFSQTVTINLYTSLDTTLDGADALTLTTAKKLKIKSEHEKAIKLKIRNFPAGLSDGVYHVIAQVVPAAGTTATAVTDATSNIQAPFVNLAGTMVAPTAITIGKKSAVKAVVQNLGNVLLSGTVMIDVQATPQIVTDVINTLASIPVKLKLKPNHGKKVTLKFLTPANLTAGQSYTFNVVLDSTSLVTESTEADNLIVSATPTLVS